MYFFLHFDTIASSRVFAKKRRRKLKKEIIQSTLLLIIMVVCVKIFYTYLWWHYSFLTIKFVAVFFSLFMSEFFFSFFPPFAFFLVFFGNNWLFVVFNFIKQRLLNSLLLIFLSHLLGVYFRHLN